MRRSGIAPAMIVMIVFTSLLFSQKMSVKDDEAHMLMEVYDEGTTGSIGLPSGMQPVSTANKLYNISGTLYWSGSALGTSSHAGGWVDSGLNVYTASSTDKVGIGTTAPEFKLSLDDDGGIIAKGHQNVGATLATSGEGVRLIWYPRKYAFRAGYANSTEWDDANIGSGSAAMGSQTTASGYFSVAMGYTCRAIEAYAVAMGAYTEAHEAATAFGWYTNASGGASTALGSYTQAEALNSCAIGQYNIGGGSGGSWIWTDPIFEIGNGINAESRSNALTVLKNGHVGLGVTSPDQELEIDGSGVLIEAGNSGLINSPLIQIGVDGNGHSFIQANHASGSPSLDINLITRNAGVSNAAMTLKGNGNVGIGTTSPQAKLHVNAVMRLEPQGSAPSGGLGDLYAGTDGKLYFHNGTTWKEVQLTP